jgi:hypothetical protein
MVRVVKFKNEIDTIFRSFIHHLLNRGQCSTRDLREARIQMDVQVLHRRTHEDLGTSFRNRQIQTTNISASKFFFKTADQEHSPCEIQFWNYSGKAPIRHLLQSLEVAGPRQKTWVNFGCVCWIEEQGHGAILPWILKLLEQDFEKGAERRRRHSICAEQFWIHRAGKGEH